MNEMREEMKVYSEKRLQEIVEASMEEAKERHTELVSRTFDHQLNLEKMKKECDKAVRDMNKFKAKYGDASQENRAVTTIADEYIQRMNNLEDELHSMNENFGKLDKRVEDVMGPVGSNNQMEIKCNAFAEEMETRASEASGKLTTIHDTIQTIEKRFTLFEDVTLPHINQIDAKCSGIYTKLSKEVAKWEKNTDHTTKCEQAQASVKREVEQMRTIIIKMNEARGQVEEARAEAAASAVVLQEMGPLAKRLESAIKESGMTEYMDEIAAQRVTAGELTAGVALHVFVPR